MKSRINKMINPIPLQHKVKESKKVDITKIQKILRMMRNSKNLAVWIKISYSTRLLMNVLREKNTTEIVRGLEKMKLRKKINLNKFIVKIQKASSNRMIIHRSFSQTHQQ